MFKLLGILFLVLVFFALLAFMLFASAILSVIHRILKMLNGDGSRQDDYTGRRQQQYTYRGRKPGQQTSNGQRTQHTRQSGNKNTNNETIFDTRSQDRTDKRIFDDNEGEYVDFIEEK